MLLLSCGSVLSLFHENLEILRTHAHMNEIQGTQSQVTQKLVELNLGRQNIFSTDRKRFQQTQDFRCQGWIQIFYELCLM